MEKVNKNIPIYNFIFSSLKEKKNIIKENIFLGNIHFPSKMKYSVNENSFNSKIHNLFLNNLSNQLKLAKIKEEKDFLYNKVEITNNKLNNINKNNIIYNRDNENPLSKNKEKSISSVDNMNTLPLLKEINNNEINLINKKEIKKYNFKHKILKQEKENDLTKKAKEFINRINESKRNNLSSRREKQQKDYLKLKKQIEIIDKKREMREEFELQRKNEQKIENMKKKAINISNVKFPNKRYHYYKNNQKILLKNFTEEIGDLNSQLYYYPFGIGNNYRILNNNKKEIIEQNRKNKFINEGIITEGNIPYFNNNKNKMIENRYQNINEAQGANNNSIINTEKKNLYFFNV